MTDDYRIVVGSLPDYKELVAEIYIGDQFVGLLSQEHGRGKTVVELAGISKMPLATFEAAIEEAKRRLSALDRAP